MPKVEQYDWDKLRPRSLKYPFGETGTKDFAAHGYIEKRSNSKHGAIKITRPAKNKWKPNLKQKAEYAEKKYQEGLGRSLRRRFM